jgi:uncharacterized protein YjeT (DUF2065 family)
MDEAVDRTEVPTRAGSFAGWIARRDVMTIAFALLLVHEPTYLFLVPSAFMSLVGTLIMFRSPLRSMSSPARCC